MDQQTYRTRKEAKAAIEKMSGWDAKVSQLYMPDSPDANKSGNVFVIEIKDQRNPPLYMRTDGYVR